MVQTSPQDARPQLRIGGILEYSASILDVFRRLPDAQDVHVQDPEEQLAMEP